jgi:EamA domain-containing membrane protein RarD
MKKAFIQLHAAIFLAGFTGILGRLITLNEGLLVWYRMLFSALGLFVLLLLTGKNTRWPSRGLPAMLGVGGIIALHWVFFLWQHQIRQCIDRPGLLFGRWLLHGAD